MWFARLTPDPDAAYVVGEGPTRPGSVYPTILLDRDDTVIGEGLSPQALTPHAVIWASDDAIQQYALEAGSVSLLVRVARPINALATNGAGRWLAWCAPAPGYPDPVCVLDDGQTLAGLHMPAWEEEGPGLVAVRGTDGALVTAAGRVLGEAAVAPRWTRAGLAWSHHGDHGPRVAPVDMWGDWPAHLAVPVWTPYGPLLLRLEDARLVLHPQGQTDGWVVHGRPETLYPDARWSRRHSGVRVVWTWPDGQLGEALVRVLETPQVPLRAVSGPAPVVVTPPTHDAPTEAPTSPHTEDPTMPDLTDLERRVKALEQNAVTFNSRVALQADNGQFVCAEGGGGQEVVANRTEAKGWETFTLRQPG